MRPFLPILALSFSLTASAAAVPNRLETIARQADAARSQEHVPEAIRLYSEAVRLRPAWQEGWWSLGTLLYDQDRFPEAATAFHHLLTSVPHRGAVYAFLGLCDYESGKYDEALAQFRSWASAGWSGTEQLHEVASYHFALLLNREGRSVEALALLDPLAKHFGDTPELTEAMGLASLRVRAVAGEYPPELRERVWLAGKAALHAALLPRDFTRANEYADRLEARYPDQPEVHFFRATLDKFQGNPEAEEREYREELRISPNHAPALTALAEIELQKGDSEQSAILARRAVAADADNAEAHHILGRVLLDSGDAEGALGELETAKRLAPGIPLVHSHLALAYRKLGRVKEAKAEAEAFLALDSKQGAVSPTHEKASAGKARKTN